MSKTCQLPRGLTVKRYRHVDIRGKTAMGYIKYLLGPTAGLFIWDKVTPVSEKKFRQVYKQDLACLRK